MFIEMFAAASFGGFILLLLGLYGEEKRPVFLVGGGLILLLTGLMVAWENIDIETGKTVELITNTTWVENSTIANITDVGIDTLTNENHTYVYTSLNTDYRNGLGMFYSIMGVFAVLGACYMYWQNWKEKE